MMRDYPCRGNEVPATSEERTMRTDLENIEDVQDRRSDGPPPVERCLDCDGTGVTGTSPGSPPCGTCEPFLRSSWDKEQGNPFDGHLHDLTRQEDRRPKSHRTGRVYTALDDALRRVPCEACRFPGEDGVHHPECPVSRRVKMSPEERAAHDTEIDEEIHHLQEKMAATAARAAKVADVLLDGISPSRRLASSFDVEPDEPTGHGVEDLAANRRAQKDAEFKQKSADAVQESFSEDLSVLCAAVVDPEDDVEPAGSDVARAWPKRLSGFDCGCGFKGPGPHYCTGEPTTGRTGWSAEDALDKRRSGYELKGEARGKESARHLFGDIDKRPGRMVERAKTQADRRVEENVRRLGLS